MQLEAMFEAVATPLLRVGPDRTIRYANKEARDLFGGDVAGTCVDRLFREPGSWDLCMAGGSIETELVCENLPLRASVRGARIGDEVIATIVVHEVRAMLSGLTHILSAGGDLAMLFNRLTPFLGDRIPYRRCSLALWHENLQQFEVYSHHPDTSGERDQQGEMVDRQHLAGLVSMADRHRPFLRELPPVARARLVEIAGFEPGTVLHVPLHYQQRYLGVLSLARGAGESYSDREIQQLEPIAGPLALGVEISRLLRDLQERERTYRDRYEEAPSMYHVIDAGGRIVDVNRCEAEALGYAKDELLGRRLSTLLTEASRQQLEHALDDFKHTGQLAFQGEREFLRKDGTILHAHLASTVQYGPSGELEQVRTIVRDLSQQKVQLQRRLQAQKLESLGRMVGGITHEFNNLLGPILGYAQLLRRRIGNVEAPELVQIEEAAQKSRSILQSLLHFTRQTKPQKKYQDLGQILEQTVTLVASRAARHHVEIDLVVPREMPWTRVDETQMTQLFLNLVNNAIEAMPSDGGRIRINLSPQGPWIQAIVRDDAGGIDDAIMPNLFDPFFSARADQQGTGLGLATCFGIVAEHGGSISVSNATLGGRPGARFEILLPVRRRPTINLRRPSAAQTPPDLRGRRALVIEDDDRYNRMICQLLEDLGALIATARDGLEGSRMITDARTPYDLVVCDIRLPHMDGTDLVRWMARHKPEMTGRVLLVTGDTLDERTARLTEQLGLEPIPKPFEIGDFYRRVLQILPLASGAGTA